MANLANLLHDSGADNIPGISAIYYADHGDVLTWPTPTSGDPTAAVDFDTLVTIPGDIIMDVGKEFKKIYLTRETGEHRFEQQGEYDGKSFKQVLEFLHPGSKAAVDGFASWAGNANAVFILIDKEGNKFLFGSQYEPAKSQSLTGTGGMAPEDRKGSTFIFDFNNERNRLYFTGDVLLTDFAQSPGEGGTQTIAA